MVGDFEDGELPTDSDGVAEFFSAVGKIIKFLRERAGMTQKEMAERLGYGEDLIGSIERGRRTPRVEFLNAADELLCAGGMLKAIAEDVMKAKVRVSTRHPAFSKAFTSEEAKAVEIHEYSIVAMPGLLQTEAHARALFRMRRPWLSTDQVNKWVAARMARQEILTRSSLPIMSWVIDEGVLRRPLGGWDVHREQLQRVIEVAEMWGTEIQVMPLDRSEHAGMGGSFVLLTPAGTTQVAYVEVQHVNRLITEPEDVRKMVARYSSIRAQALDPRESMALIQMMLGERKHDRADVVQEQLQH
ncbi:Scr1 family TA system antitoxin-like transcriptional regulator [Kitasatospora purpeofusca]|uniref:helix-turn-helix domain-containing protein n=1 Tax=Kitasatospora purpeofusca TaxID=67352 RepID=UPI00368114E2